MEATQSVAERGEGGGSGRRCKKKEKKRVSSDGRSKNSARLPDDETLYLSPHYSSSFYKRTVQAFVTEKYSCSLLLADRRAFHAFASAALLQIASPLLSFDDFRLSRRARSSKMIDHLKEPAIDEGRQFLPLSPIFKNACRPFF